jgi:beta-N-acetylhexosaminidase
MTAQTPISAVGQHFFIGLRPAPVLSAEDRALLADLRPAGVILFKSNFIHDQPYEVWLASHAQLITDVRAAVARDKLIIAIDHEGGRVCRTPPPITRFSYAAHWAARASAVGEAMGRELASLGVNVSFAPVLDIHSNPSNPVIGLRAFGTTVEQVSEAALAYMAALQKQGVLACGKHFPGHGDTDTDSHHALPVLHQDLAALRSRELKPFLAAIRAHIPMIMSGHILLPAVDAVEPATLSHRFIQETLRDEMKFDGVVVSDDIGMHAVSKMFEQPGTMGRLLRSGTDIVMVCAHWTDTERSRTLARSLLDEVESGAIPAAVMARSRARIEALLAGSASHAVTALSAGTFAAHRNAGALFDAATVEVV